MKAKKIEPVLDADLPRRLASLLMKILIEQNDNGFNERCAEPEFLPVGRRS